MNQIPRPEYPQPQFQRETWQNLNGQWDFLIDAGASGLDQHFETTGTFDRQITVPFAPESPLSGINEKDFMQAVWYRRHITLTEAQLQNVVRLHFGAVDYEAHVFVNGEEIGQHRGGYASFAFDIQAALVPGDNTLVICAIDHLRSGAQPSGKQSRAYQSQGCDYTRTTGIWQTVWLEFLPIVHVQDVQFTPNRLAQSVTVAVTLAGQADLAVAVSYQGQACGQAQLDGAHGQVSFTIPLSEVHLWEAGHGRLYDVTVSFGADTVKSYFGLRDVRFDGLKFLLNDQSVFQRLVLDQGFYPDGIYTAPTDEAFKKDIQLSLDAGFNGARLHQKANDPRLLYWCDKMGYLVWGEMASWGVDMASAEGLYNFLPEWEEIVARDINHPAIITWCPFNESWDINGRQQRKDAISIVYATTKQLDPSRPCVDVSGNFHTAQTDVYDLHDYEQDPAKFAEHFDGSKWPNGQFRDEHEGRQYYHAGWPLAVSEYGGIKWAPDVAKDAAWGYGDGPETPEAFLARYKGLTEVLLNDPRICSFCYTQLYDVEQERNGLYYYDRTPKFDVALFKAINAQIAAIER
ncbi:glycoside hydrolase family 2 protein [Lacticaseibacillus jixiensis]|uniref:glycoside hydrolase family 2 protein n=1 Tax=Lacticaseibacillus jixiensis TaxID=3231926 RepID=UPI0036F28E7D